MPIAIIGMACRFPGDGENIESLFEMLKRGENAWSEFPADRVNIDGFYHPSGNRQGSIGFRGAHFLKGDIKGFDAPVSFLSLSNPFSSGSYMPLMSSIASLALSKPLANADSEILCTVLQHLFYRSPGY